MSLDSDKFIGEGLTYDDVLLVPAYSEVLPREVDLSSFFTKKIKLNTPIVSAAMDTVTEYQLAIAIAQEGGIGVLHKNMTIQEQAEHVRKVKRSESGMIQDPITVSETSTVAQVLALMKEHKIGGIPVVDASRKLKGIVTNRDLRFEKNMKRLVSEVMTKDNLITAKQGTDLKKAEVILQDNKIEKLPVVDKNYRLVGLITYKDIIKVKIRPMACKDHLGRLRVAAAVGVTANVYERVEALVNAAVDAIIIDTAHGHSMHVINTLKAVKKKYPDLQVVVGNVATAEAGKALVKAGADGVKVGIGPGSICTTRIIAGVEESPGDTIIYEGRKFKSYRGMGSIEAMQQGSKDRYFQDAEDDIKKLVPEGISGRVPFKGALAEVIYQMIGGLRAGMGYCGAKNIETLQKAKFIRITASGMRESHPHDIVITREAPNYSTK
jgi:IMP dehydrogenase